MSAKQPEFIVKESEAHRDGDRVTIDFRTLANCGLAFHMDCQQAEELQHQLGRAVHLRPCSPAAVPH